MPCSDCSYVFTKLSLERSSSATVLLSFTAAFCLAQIYATRQCSELSSWESQIRTCVRIVVRASNHPNSFLKFQPTSQRLQVSIGLFHRSPNRLRCKVYAKVKLFPQRIWFDVPWSFYCCQLHQGNQIKYPLQLQLLLFHTQDLTLYCIHLSERMIFGAQGRSNFAVCWLEFVLRRTAALMLILCLPL